VLDRPAPGRDDRADNDRAQVVSGLSHSVRVLTAGLVPPKVVQSRTSAGGYKGPCPPQGELHNYTFTIYAEGKKLGLSASTPTDKALAAIQEGPLEKATLTGRFVH
jgi:phosphatidylethanolamine-binding protein (PEBP) family uncharacterized protein